MKGRVLALIAAVLALGLMSACASVSLKDRITQGLQVTNVAVNTANAAETTLFESGVLKDAWTPEKRRAFHGALVRYYDAVDTVVDAMLVWRASDPPPANVLQGLTTAYEALGEAIKVSPSSGFTSVLTQMQAAVRGLVDLINLTKGNEP